MLQWFSRLWAFFWSLLISQVVKPLPNPSFLLIYLTRSLFLTMKNVQRGRDAGNDREDGNWIMVCHQGTRAFCARKLISIPSRCNYEVTRNLITRQTKEKKKIVFLPLSKGKIKGLIQLIIRKWLVKWWKETDLFFQLSRQRNLAPV